MNNFSLPDIRADFPNPGIFIRNLKSVTAAFIERQRQYSIARQNANRLRRKIDLSSRYLNSLSTS